MNLFGAFNFGRLIKTFLPGFILLIALVMGLDCLCTLTTAKVSFIDIIIKEPVIFSLMSIPVSLILGIFSNMVLYAGLNNLLVKNPVKKKNPELIQYYNSQLEIIIRYSIGKNSYSKKYKNSLIKHLDPIFLMLHEMDLQKLVFIQESYWYYLEFQMNAMFAIFVTYIFAILWFTLKAHPIISGKSFYILIAIISFLVISLSWLCIFCARKNYKKHIQKMLSYCVGIYKNRNKYK